MLREKIERESRPYEGPKDEIEEEGRERRLLDLKKYLEKHQARLQALEQEVEILKMVLETK